MTDADEREFSYGEMALLIAQHIVRHGSISPAEAIDLTGRDKDAVLRVFRCMDRVLAVYREPSGRRVMSDD